MSNLKYEAPKLTKYGKVADLIEAGSVIATGDVTGDGIDDTLFRYAGGGYVVIGGANGGRTPVTKIRVDGNYTDFDADGDGRGGINSLFGDLRPNLGGSGILETAADDGWDDPARD